MYRGVRSIATSSIRVCQARSQLRAWTINRSFASSTSGSTSKPKTDKWSTPSTDPGANRKTTAAEGSEKTQKSHTQSAAAEKAEKESDYGGNKATAGPKASAVNKESPSASAHEIHRSRDDYAFRDQGTGSEENVAADRSKNDPLPDDKKHSHSHGASSTSTATGKGTLGSSATRSKLVNADKV